MLVRRFFFLVVMISFGMFCVAACPVGDLSGNCSVGLEDLVLFAGSWLDEPGGTANLDGLGKVDIKDFAILAEHWEQGEYQLLINEFMADNKTTIEDPDGAGQYPDWIEIYNPGATSVDIGGMYLTDTLSIPKMWQIPTNAPAQTTIEGGDYLLIWADGNTSQGPLHAGFGLGAGGEEIGLFDSQGTQLDAITFGSQSADESYGRYPNGGAEWQTFSDGTATPGWSNGGASTDTGILISEIMYHPGHNELAFEPEPIELEYIELYNAGTSAVNLGGWRLVDGVQYQLPANTLIAANGYLVIVADETAFSAAYPSVSNKVGGWTGKLSNKGEQITLVNAIGTVIDSVEYSDEGEWAQRLLGPTDHNHRGWLWSDAHDGGGRSLELICANQSNEYGQNWKTSTAGTGTPGLANSVASADLAPIILNVKHKSVVPNSSDTVVVTAEVTDTDLAGVTLRWRVDTSVYVKASYPVYNGASYTSVVMADDGVSGDGQAGDGIYGASIPPQADGTIVEFFIEATDGSANTRTWPASCDVDGTPQQVANSLYQVDDSFADDTAWVGGKQPVYYIIMTEAERGRLEEIGAGDDYERFSDAQMNATFISVDGVDTKTRYTVGVRNRGEGSRRLPPNNHRVNFRHDNLWKNVSAININSKYTHLQLAGSAIFRMAGLAAADGKAVQVRVNGEDLSLTDSNPARMYGTYVHLEAIDSDFATNHFPNDGDGNIYKASIYPQVADLTYLGTNPADYVDDGYTKGTNGSENDWTDLFELTNVLTNEPDATFVERLEQVVNTDQWIRWFAVQTLIGNNETNLGNGYGDDYRMYRGVVDPRFTLVTHDMDTVLGKGDSPAGVGDSIWDADRLANIERFLKHPEYVWRYYAELKRLTETVFASETMDPLLDTLLGGFVPESAVAQMKQFVADRNANVLSQIPQTFSATSSLSVVSGFNQTTVATAPVNGTADATVTRAVRVNGVLADWDGVEGAWSITGVSMLPGINRVIVQTYGDAAGLGQELKRGYVDIWYNDGSESTLSGTLASNTVLSAASGPWRVTGSVTVPNGVTLTIQPGTTLFFNSGTGITIEPSGRIVAEGTDYQRIRLTRVPGGASWSGLNFNASQSTPGTTDNRLCYLDMDYGSGQGSSVKGTSSQILIDHMSWGGTNSAVVDLRNPRVTLSNSFIPGITGEPIHGLYITGDEYFILKSNTFGAGTSDGDIIDWDTSEMFQTTDVKFFAFDNVFLGGGDDGLDMDATDSYIEGNVFMNFATVNSATTSNPVAGGKTWSTGSTNDPDYTVVRNVFMNNEHCLLLKENGYAHIANNTFFNTSDAVVQFCENGRNVSGPGRGADIESSILWGYDRPLKYLVDEGDLDPSTGWPADPVVTVNNSIITSAPYLGSGNVTGAGNLDANPVFVDEPDNLMLMEISAAIGSGINGIDMGAYIPAGANVSGEPDAVTWRTGAVLTVGGPAITHYKWRLKDNGVFTGAFSGELPISTPITLSGLQNGHTYSVYVVGKNSAGLWAGDLGGLCPGDPAGNPSHEWTVDVASRKLVINEVLASNATIAHEGTYPDMVELYYDGPSSIDLGGYSLTDNIDLPTKFVFASGTIMNPGDYLVVYAGLVDGTSGIHTGFLIDADGDDLYLFDNVGAPVDSVQFGVQLVDKSIGCYGHGDSWTLTLPTFGSANVRCPLGDARKLKINEWLADAKILFVDDWIELFNPQQWPVDMGGYYLSDDPVAEPNKCLIRPLSFVEANGYVVYKADGQNAAGHVNFNLSADGEIIGLYDAGLNEVDKVLFGPQGTDISQGRAPDGGDNLAFFALPTPGVLNATVTTTVTTDELVNMTDVWSYEQSGTDLGASWRNPGYNDSAWPTGAALLYVESSSLPAPKNTPLTLGKNTYYFRKHFTFSGDPAAFDQLELSTVIDDGAVIYLNGVEIQKIRLPGTVTYSTYADPYVDNAGLEGFTIPTTYLLNGDNVIAAEVHQSSSGSSDIVFGLGLDGMNITTVIEDDYVDDGAVLDGLRITEIMYNPAADPNSEFIELKNISGVAINLEGVRFTNGIDFVFPQMTLDPGQYTVVVANQSVFEARYGTQINVAGVYTGKLANGGEQITLKLAEPLDAAVMRFEYKDGWYPTTDGGGYSLVIVDPTGTLASWQDAESWRPSYAAGGTPGADDIAGVMINEVLAHSHDTAPDWIELYNPTAGPVNVGGWYLSDSVDNLMKYQIAANTIIASGSYLVLDEDTHFGSQFALSENGDQVYLSSGENGMLTGYTVEVSFGASETGVSFGHYTKSDATTVFVSMNSITPNAINSGPKVGPVVISEIMYNPTAGGSYAAQDYEYIELHNISGSPVTLEVYDSETFETLGWQFTAGIDFVFPLGTTIPADGRLIVAKNPAAFTERHGNGMTVLGPFENATNLSNGGELLELSMPGDTDLLDVRYYILVDSVLYDDASPWPATPDGGGAALDRVNDALYGDDVINWQAQTPAPGV